MITEEIDDDILIHNKGAVQNLLKHFCIDKWVPSAAHLPCVIGSTVHNKYGFPDHKAYQRLIVRLLYIANTTRPILRIQHDI